MLIISISQRTSAEEVLHGANVAPVGGLVQGRATSGALSAAWVGASLN